MHFSPRVATGNAGILTASILTRAYVSYLCLFFSSSSFSNCYVSTQQRVRQRSPSLVSFFVLLFLLQLFVQRFVFNPVGTCSLCESMRFYHVSTCVAGGQKFCILYLAKALSAQDHSVPIRPSRKHSRFETSTLAQHTSCNWQLIVSNSLMLIRSDSGWL